MLATKGQEKLRSVVRRYWLTISFVLGFMTDLILLNQIDSLVDNLILLGYALLASFSLIFFYLGVSHKGPDGLNEKLVRYAPLFMQYSFGGLLSGMLIFYGRSGDWLNSAPYLLLIVAVIIGNELVNKRSDKLVFHLALYFIGLFSYVVLVVPVITGLMGDVIFLISGLIALGIVTLLVQVLRQIVPNFIRQNTKRIILSIGFTYVGLNTLYFANVIPPIPLSLTELEIYQSVTRLENGSYRVVDETQPLARRLPILQEVIHPMDGTIACFARVYAPTRLSTEIFHRWQYRPAGGDWTESLELGYGIAGTNRGGYGGYTTVTAFTEGEWRCNVETERGQLLGRVTVTVERGPAGALVTRYK
jgi:hypothetical protein